MLEDLVEDLRVVQAPPQIDRDRCHHRSVDLVQPAVGGDRLGDRPAGCLFEIAPETGDVGQ